LLITGLTIHMFWFGFCFLEWMTYLYNLALGLQMAYSIVFMYRVGCITRGGFLSGIFVAFHFKETAVIILLFCGWHAYMNSLSLSFCLFISLSLSLSLSLSYSRCLVYPSHPDSHNISNSFYLSISLLKFFTPFFFISQFSTFFTLHQEILLPLLLSYIYL
jgi:hypothetical protein